MKKSLLKATLICFGVILLCGLSSFMTPEEVKSPRSNYAMSIIYDTIITPEGEGSQCIREVVVESDQGDCLCSLYVTHSTGSWTLWLARSRFGRSIEATIEYRIYSGNSSKKIKETTNLPGNYSNNPIHSGFLSSSDCRPVSLKACFND